MGRTPCCNKEGLRKGAWTTEEDKTLVAYITKNGHGSWESLPKLAGLLRCGKSCRLRWTNYLRPGIKRGKFSSEEVDSIIQLHSVLGNRWSAIASHLSGRTDNDIKNLWNSHLRKKQEIVVPNINRNHMVQPESCASVEPLLLDLPSASKTEIRDPFLRLWNSEVGEAFRNSKKPYGVPCHSPVSHASSSSKFESSSGITLHSEPTSNILSSADKMVTKKWEEQDHGVVSESTKSYELDDPSETTLNLLLDFPEVNDTGFFQGPGENLSIYFQN